MLSVTTRKVIFSLVVPGAGAAWCHGGSCTARRRTDAGHLARYRRQMARDNPDWGLRPLPEPITDPAALTRLHVRRRNRLGGLLQEYENAT